MTLRHICLFRSWPWFIVEEIQYKKCKNFFFLRRKIKSCLVSFILWRLMKSCVSCSQKMQFLNYNKKFNETNITLKNLLDVLGAPDDLVVHRQHEFQEFLPIFLSKFFLETFQRHRTWAMRTPLKTTPKIKT